ncbi:TIGR01777 family oxidoreductase [Paenibacillus glycanilyticus]|uniref:TIGR01777 family oxidoreductase n=1 Tax=Paenibacillus glycanilyticus TaxID=126569 RepID=UPI0020410AE4|nr:TIGR01777 family oxidoreductase [Paenibacillus glycanilyticus]MCM3628825.1 TIGR01777 family oxidoreductase [Paenibacillus glycanilyticus]
MRVAVTGGTGFVGRALVKALLERGDEVWVISRHSSSESGRLHHATWDELAASPDRLEGVDVIVNLAGESINQRWTAAAKQRVLKSRTDAAARIATLIEGLKQKPEAVINASGISAYGSSLSATFDEDSPLKVTDFLSGVVEHWEKAADTIPVKRLVKLRVGVVLNRTGGAFPLMALPHRLFAGGRLGSGSQWLSWIHLEDIVRLILFCIDNPDMQGPVNGSAPEPVTNDQFGRALGKAIGRPHWLPAPAFLMKALLGEMSSLLLEGQRALPRKALEHGFTFKYPTIESAMNQIGQKKAEDGS